MYLNSSEHGLQNKEQGHEQSDSSRQGGGRDEEANPAEDNHRAGGDNVFEDVHPGVPLHGDSESDLGVGQVARDHSVHVFDPVHIKRREGDLKGLEVQVIISIKGPLEDQDRLVV